MNLDQLILHPEATRVPMMRSKEYAEFLADVRERGVRVPVELQPGTKIILDGRCRYTAAKESGLRDIPTVEANLNGDDPVVYMLRAASKRRQLSDDQRAMIADEERAYLAERNRREQTKRAGKASGETRAKERRDHGVPHVQPPPVDKARTVAARAHNVSERKVQQAQTVKKHSPELAEKVKAGEVPLAQAARQVQREQKLAELETKAAAAPADASDDQRIIHGDCLAEMAKMPPRSARLIFADPPYNIGVDYGAGARADRLPDSQYLPWVKRWMDDAKRILTDDGSLWVLIGDEYAAEFGGMLKGLGFTVRAWIKWYETFGVNCPNNFNRCSRHLFYCVVDPKHYVFHASAVNRPSDRQTKYNDRRAEPGGKIWDDVWQIPRLVGTANERIPAFPTQLPLDLLRPIVGCASDPGDRIIDPFTGSGTTACACKELGRRFVGIEQSRKFHDLATKRLKAHQ